MSDDKIKAFIMGSIPGGVTGVLFLFNNTSVGEYAFVANFLKLIMAFSLAAVTGMGTLAGKYLYNRIKTIIIKRKIKKYVERREKERNRQRRA